MPGNTDQYARSLEVRKELAILACSADRLELELIASRAKRRDQELAERWPRAWPWVKVLEELIGHFDGVEKGPLSWLSALKPILSVFKAAA